MEKLNRLDTIAEENEAYMNRMRERFAHFNIVGEEDKGWFLVELVLMCSVYQNPIIHRRIRVAVVGRVRMSEL